MSTAPIEIELDPGRAEALTGGRWIGPRRTLRLRGAAIDSRRVTPGCIFACFVGERVDGHDYAAAAAGDGAGLILASTEVEVPVPVLLVADVAAALAALAGSLRARSDAITWIAVTGSNGKTTVKDLLAAACSPAGPVHATAGNLNNHLGVPLTILATPEGTRTAVVELGASAQGEIAMLTEIVRPDIGIITSIGPAHLEGFGGLAGVCEGKTELFAHMGPGRRMFFARYGLEDACARHGANAGAILARVRERAAHGDLVVIGDPGCAVEGSVADQGVVLRTPVGEVGLRLIGEHNLTNAALAWHAAVAAGVDPKRALGALAAARPTAGRLQVRALGEHRLFDDSYNANPASMQAGLQVLAHQPGARIAVLGAMGELGPESERMHAGVGALCARLGLPLVTVCAAAEPIAEGYRAAGGRDHHHTPTIKRAVAHLVERLRIGPTAVLVKASRSSGLEAVVDGLTHHLGYGSGTRQATSEERRPC